MGSQRLKPEDRLLYCAFGQDDRCNKSAERRQRGGPAKVLAGPATTLRAQRAQRVPPGRPRSSGATAERMGAGPKSETAARWLSQACAQSGCPRW